MERFGRIFFVFLYFSGFILYSEEIYDTSGKNFDKETYAKNTSGLPDFYWEDNCYTGKNVELTDNYPLSFVMFLTFTGIYIVPIITIYTIMKKFRPQSNRNAKNQQVLLKSLLIQTLIYLFMYTFPSQITSSSLYYDWFNPGVILSCLAVVRCHGSFVTVSIFLTTPAFRRDLLGLAGGKTNVQRVGSIALT
ncbi:unnamed protein product [Caenorhabditis angaria]|uniref:Uncharacterized protein n=1 Tax=Caenorhabditis angaria TaxID=860376 RepID=A0A9P1IV15_9PELO|nr:unnamed protein product [Caenorhabditis angaria]